MTKVLVKRLYIQYLRREAEWIEHDKKADEKCDEHRVEMGFQFAKAKLDGGDKSTVKV